MHIAEGVLSIPVLTTGGVVAAAGIAWGLRCLPWDRLVTTAVLSALFFVASLVHVPIGPSSVHLIMSGVAGLLLGPAAFPAIFTALLLQALLFQFGGLTVLGVNTVIMALPAVCLGIVFRPFLNKNRGMRRVAAFLCGALAIAGSAFLASAALYCTDADFLATAGALFAAHLPVMAIEGVVTMLVVDFLARTSPELLSPPRQG